MSEKIVQLNEEVIKGQLKELVRGSVEETLNELLEQEAEKLTQAARYERNEVRQGYRSGHYPNTSVSFLAADGKSGFSHRWPYVQLQSMMIFIVNIAYLFRKVKRI